MKKRSCFIKKSILGAVFLILATWGTMPVFAANVLINLVAVNPSEDESKEAEIKHFLPKELGEEDIVETGGLKLEYDVDEEAYYVQGSVTLAPKESRTIRIEVKDVWYINPSEIEILKSQIEENISLLEGKDYYEAALTLKENMFAKLDYIMAQQTNYSENVERRIEEYRAHVEKFNEIRDNAFSLEYFKDAQKKLIEEGNVRFIIEVQNPSDEEVKKVRHKHYLPKEVLSGDIIEAGDFEVRFDSEKHQTYLTKEENFEPAQKKRYEIVIKDVWRIPLEEVGTIRETTNATMKELSESEYVGKANYLFDRIMETLELIESSQKNKEDMARYIGSFRSNRERLALAEKDLDKLLKLLAFVRSKKLEELEKGKVKNILQKIQALRGIAALSKAVFGKRPSLTLTWMVIWGTMAFVALFTTFHFFTWWKRSKIMGEQVALKHGGVIKEVTSVESGTEEKEEK